MTRHYKLGKRAETAEETRRRVIQATYELHAEKGIAATTIRDIAGRADVSPGTVYHHFPSYDDVIVACGQYTFGIKQPPTREILDGLASPAEKLQALVAESFAFYRRFPEYERIRAERGDFVPLEYAFSADEEARRELIREALRPKRATKGAVAVAFALIDISVYHRLVRSGLTHSAAVDEIGQLLIKRLLGE